MRLDGIIFDKDGTLFDFGETWNSWALSLIAELSDGDPALAEAWEALTRGRKRSHVIHVGGAKQAATRERRVGKCVPKILAGKGFLDR